MNNLDKYYTNDSTVKFCMKLFKKYVKINPNDIIIEPSAGNGAFFKYLKKYKNVFLYDIKPDNKFIIKQNFLKLKDIKKSPNQFIHILGNPPFGKKSSMAIKFIKKSCSFANTISFILPKSFKKHSNQKAFSLNYHLILQKDLPINSFYYKDNIYNIPCIFQIWKKRNYNRNIIKKPFTFDFKFVKKNNNPDIAIRRVGSKSGIVSLNYNDKNISTHYFIKILRKNKKEVINKLRNIKYEFNNTIGAKSISKYELINYYNKF